MTITKWKTGYSGTAITQVEAIRETDLSLWFARVLFGKTMEERTNKRGAYENYFDSWEDARDFLLRKAESRAVTASHELEVANSLAGDIRGMKRP